MKSKQRSALLALPPILVVGALVALAGSVGGRRVAGMPVLSLAFALAFAIQWVAFVPAYIGRTERFYDLVGSVTYLSAASVAVALSSPADGRALLLLAVVAVWAVRLGSFLLRRVLERGQDERFEELKRSFAGFLRAWTLQGLWVSLTLAAALGAITSEVQRPLGVMAWLGVAVWGAGFGIEAIADRQKRRFRADPANRGRFIQSGLWSWSRHPNYFGEIVLWLGVAIIAVPVLRGWQYVTLVSPLFVALLLTKVSGIPILEARADDRWGGDEDYERYKRRTSILVPLPPRD